MGPRIAARGRGAAALARHELAIGVGITREDEGADAERGKPIVGVADGALAVGVAGEHSAREKRPIELRELGI